MGGFGAVRTLVRSTLIYSAGNFANQAIPFLLLPLLTRFIPAEGYGYIATFEAMLGIWVAIVGLNTHGAVSRAYFDDTIDDFAGYVGTCAAILALSALLALLITFLLHKPLAAATDMQLVWIIGATAAAGGQFLGLLALTVWQVSEQPVRYTTFQVSRGTFNMGLSILLVVPLTLGWQGRLSAIIIAFATSGVLAVLLLWRTGRLRFAWRKVYAKDALHFGIPLVPHSLSAWLMLAVDRLMLMALIGPAATGVYAVGHQLGMGISLVQNSFNQAWVPWFFSRMSADNPEARAEIRNATILYITSLFALCGIVALAAGPLVSLVAPSEYSDAKKIVPWIAVAFGSAGVYKIGANYLFYWKRTGLLAMITVCMSVLHLLLNWVLIKRLEALGAAVAALVTWTVYAAVTVSVVVHLGRRKPRSTFGLSD